MHGYLRIYSRTLGTEFTDNKDASSTIWMGFADRFVVSHHTQEFTERRFLMDESLYKGHLAWLVLIQFLQLYSFHCICWRIYFAGIFSQNF